MSAEENKALVQRMIEEVWNKGNVAVLDEISADDALTHDASVPTGTMDRKGYHQFVNQYRTAFPDLHFTTEALLADGDYVTWRYSVRGTNQGPLMGIPPTGRPGMVTGISILRVSGGKIRESWQNWDTLGMIQNLGLLPSMEQLFSSAASQRPGEQPTAGGPAPH